MAKQIRFIVGSLLIGEMFYIYFQILFKIILNISNPDPVYYINSSLIALFLLIYLYYVIILNWHILFGPGGGWWFVNKMVFPFVFFLSMLIVIFANIFNLDEYSFFGCAFVAHYSYSFLSEPLKNKWQSKLQESKQPQ